MALSVLNEALFVNMIHETAIINPSAKLGSNVSIGPFCVIESDVHLGNNCRLESNVVIKANSIIGNDNHFFTGVVIGEAPQDISQTNVKSHVQIGSGNTFREYVTIHRGTDKQDHITIIGDHNFLMVNAHVGHDAVVGSHCILTNACAIGGHAVIGDRVIIGAFCAIHQFCQVGSFTMLSRGAQVNKDILPYLMIAENKPKVFGLNKVGLSRNGFSRDDIKILMQAFKLIFKSELTMQQALTALQPLAEQNNKVQAFITGLERAKRGIVR